MRSRFRTFPPRVIQTQRPYHTVGATQYWDWPTTMPVVYTPQGEWMWDIKGRRDRVAGMPAFHPVSHFEWGITPPRDGLSGPFSPAGFPNTKYWYGMAHLARYLFWSRDCEEGTNTPYWGDHDLGASLADLLFAGVPSAYDGHFDRWQRCKPTMGTRANLGVFLYELGDVKRMFDFIPKKHLRYKNRPVDNWRMTLAYANSQHLNFNFGWKPFIRDVQNVFSGLTSFDERLEKFVKGQNQLQTTHAGDPESVIESDWTWLIPTGEWGELKCTRSYRVRRNSTFQYSYSIPNYSDRELRVRSYLDTLGLHVNPQNIWAVLPWSFVVDWFYNVGNVLSRTSSDWTEPNINFVQACHSVKVDAWITCFARYTASNGISTDFIEVCNGTAQVYTRSVGMPNATFDTDELNADKIRLLSSLFLSRFL